MEATWGIVELVKSNWNSVEKQKYLKRKLNALVAIKKDINNELERAESLFTKKRKNEVANWLEDVERVEHEYQNFEAEMTEARWSKLWGGQVQSLSEEVCELIGRSKFQRGLVLDVGETKAEPFLLTNLVGEAFQDNLEKIWAWLMKDEVSRIGIYGMGGVGKTTLVTHIHNRLQQRPGTFSNVYWITISQDFSIHKLQSQIAKVIGLDLSDEEDEKKRAAKLYKAMEMKLRSVLFLDDLWNQFSLDEVGIPVHAAICKLIFTTRSLDICRKMSCHKKIKLEPLLEEESWNLFVEKLGNYATFSLEVKQVAKSVARECAGLPLGIVILAGSLKGVDDVREWRSVLEQLKQSTAAPGEMEDKVFRVLNLSYIRLKDPALQACFLCCALFPEDYEIGRTDLIDYMIGEGIIKGLNSIQAEFDRGHALLNKLENVCLLEGLPGYKRVKMHDLLRDMALNVMKENAKAIVEAAKDLTELPKETEWSRDLVRVSLMDNDIKKIPWGYSPECPSLSTLLLCGNSFLESIADSFFMQLCGLKVLDLSYTGITMLPNSVSNLVCLTILLLKHCDKLCYIPPLTMLKALKKLDLTGTRVEVMPQGLEFLLDLRYLHMGGIEIINPIELLHKLSDLQYLRLWLARPELFSDFCLGLQRMNPDKRQLLSIYEVLIGEYDRDYVRGPHNSYGNDLDGMSKRVVFNVCDIGEEGQFVVIPKDLQRLVIFQCHATRSLCNVVLVEGLANLEHCEICQCDGLDCLMSLPCSSPNIFDCIKTLKLRNLGTVRVLINREGAPPTFQWNGIFSCLKNFEMHLCPIIKSLFSCELLSNLQNLEEIVVDECQRMQEIIALDGREEAAPLPFLLGGAFLRLKRLVVRLCPSMKVLLPSDLLHLFQYLEEIEVTRCRSMEEIIAKNCRDGAAAPPSSIAGAFSCLKCFPVQDCSNTKYLFPNNLLTNLRNLEKVIVTNCWNMEEMIASEAREEGGEIMEEESSSSRSHGNRSVITTAECIFPKLSLLELRNTPKLRRIFDGKMISDSIEQITVWNCPMLQRMPMSLIQLDDEQQPFPLASLKDLRIESEEWWNSVEWDHPNAKEVLQPLLTLQKHAELKSRGNFILL